MSSTYCWFTVENFAKHEIRREETQWQAKTIINQVLLLASSNEEVTKQSLEKNKV